LHAFNTTLSTTLAGSLPQQQTAALAHTEFARLLEGYETPGRLRSRSLISYQLVVNCRQQDTRPFASDIAAGNIRRDSLKHYHSLLHKRHAIPHIPSQRSTLIYHLPFVRNSHEVLLLCTGCRRLMWSRSLNVGSRKGILIAPLHDTGTASATKHIMSWL